MMRISLFEKFIKPFDDDLKKAENRIGLLAIKKVKKVLNNPNSSEPPYKFVTDAAQIIWNWFSGYFMHVKTNYNEDVKIAIDIFKKIGESYHTPISGKVYRIAHIKVPSTYKEADILKIDRCKSGPKTIQSWSSSKKGAIWFYNRFVDKQNHRSVPSPERAWVLLETDASNLDQLVTFESLIQFLYDSAIILDPEQKIHSKWAKKLESLGNYFNIADMRKLNELICATPEEISVRVLSVFVAPGETPDKTDYMSSGFEDFLNQFLEDMKKK